MILCSLILCLILCLRVYYRIVDPNCFLVSVSYIKLEKNTILYKYIIYVAQVYHRCNRRKRITILKIRVYIRSIGRNVCRLYEKACIDVSIEGL